MNKNILTIILALAALTAGAQQQREITIAGDVKDGFLNIALPEACVSVLTTDSTVVVDTASIITIYGAHNRIAMARYVAKVDGSRREYLVRARLKGYDDVWRRVSIGKQTDVEVPTIEMRRMREIELGEVTVVATKVKFFYRGDTLVYADAGRDDERRRGDICERAQGGRTAARLALVHAWQQEGADGEPAVLHGADAESL